MPKFRYTVINPEQKKLSGVIEAPSETTAKDELNALGFSVVELAEITAESTKDRPPKGKTEVGFLFQGKDKTGHEVSGTIEGGSGYEVFKRLILEYHFEVEKLGDEPVAKLYEKLHAETSAPPKETPDETVHTERETTMKTDIALVLQRCDAFLKEFSAALKPEERTEIERHRDKLLRIKTSTNLDLIRKAAEDLLRAMQKKELFSAEQGVQDKAKSYALEARKLLSDLERGVSKKTSLSLLERIDGWEKSHAGQSLTVWQKIWWSLLATIRDLVAESPEILAIKQQLKNVRSHLWEYAFLYLKEKNPEYREGFKQSFLTLRQERRRLKEELRTVQRTLHEALALGNEPPVFERVMQELNIFSGLLVLIYSAYFVISFLLQIKSFSVAPPNFFLVGMQKNFLVSLAVLLIIHAATSVKTYFFLRRAAANFIIFPLALFFILLALLNLP